MTTLAQLHDCHSCNDERSIVQKKNADCRVREIHPQFFFLSLSFFLFGPFCRRVGWNDAAAAKKAAARPNKKAKMQC